MNKISRFKIDKSFIIIILLFMTISLISIYSAQSLITDQTLVYKQLIWYLIGFIFIGIIMFIGNETILKSIPYLYIMGVLLLILVLIFGSEINEAKCWFKIPHIGNFQPSEFMKIILILTIGKLIDNFKKAYNNPSLLDEFKFLLVIGVIVGIPSILTFLEPDTGVVLIYLIITIVMLFISGIRYRWFIIAFGSIGLLIGIILLIYFNNSDLFINIFGSSFFLRVDRLLDWSNGSGYQLEQGLTSIGSAGLFGTGIGNTPIYFPEPQTDFIFAVFSNNFGFIGSIVLIFIIVFFDFKLITLAVESPRNINKYYIGGMLGMLIYQQFQNIGMTLGLMPITGITLPFISYGGSSLLSYMIMLGIIFNISNQNIRYMN